MKLIAIEEHFLTPEIRAAWARSLVDGAAGFDDGEIGARLNDLGEGRIALMDEGGVDVQVLSVTTPALHNLDPATSVPLARDTNDRLAAVVRKFPQRFAGFATLPMAAPAEAAKELERCVRELGFCGTMVCGRTRERSMDAAEFLPVWEAAAALRVPVYIHPQVPQRAVRDVYYSGFGDAVDMAFSAFALGWHYEAGIQFVRMVLAGVFDRLPELQVVLGHWGEVVLFYLERLQAFGRVAKLGRPFAEYVKNNVYVTPSGMWSNEYLRRCMEIVGPERMIFSVDYPYQYRPGGGARKFLDETPLTAEQRELFAHGNWERLMSRVNRRAL